MKQDMHTRNDRAAKEKAIEYASRYLSKYVELSDKFYKECQEKKVVGYDGPVGDFNLNSLLPQYRSNAIKHFTLDFFRPALNELQTIASAYVTGIADEKTGFEIIGRTYCVSVASKYDILCCCRQDEIHQYYQSIIDLYNIWSPRITKAELEAERKRIEKSMSEIPDESIAPLGG